MVTHTPELVYLQHGSAIIPAEPGLVRGMEKSMVVNHLGPFLLTHLLLPDLQKSAAAGEQGESPGLASRIVNVGSRLEKRGSLWASETTESGTTIPPGPRWFYPPPAKPHHAFQLYGSSKLCTQLCTFELDRRLQAQAAKSAAAAAAGGEGGGGGGGEGGPTIIANIVTPGVCNTGLGDGTISPWISWAGPFFKGALMRTVEKGAAAVVWAATAPEVEEIGGGKFFGDMAEAPTSDASRDESLARMVWEASEVASGLEESERIV